MVDAGGKNDDPDHQNFGERNWTLMTVPHYNWGYKTVPQPNLAGREIDYSRGKGLGGSTTINFCVYTRGPSAEYDRWAQLVDDDVWSWRKVLERFYKVNMERAVSRYLSVELKSRGRGCRLKRFKNRRKTISDLSMSRNLHMAVAGKRI